MISNRPRSMVVIVTSLACLSTLALIGCGGESGSAGPPVSPPPPPVAAARLPPPAPVSPAPVASAEAAPPPVQAPPNPQGAEVSEGEQHREHHHAGVIGLIVMSLHDLDLSADQQAAVEKVKADLLTKLEPARAAGKDLANTLADGVAAGKVDRAKVDLAISKLVTQAQGIHDASIAALGQLHDALNADQRAKLVDDVQGHWEKWKAAQGRDEVDDHQHHAGYLLGLVRNVGLTQDQAEKIKAAFRDKMKGAPQEHAHKEVQDHLQAFATAFKADTFDAKKLNMAKSANGHMVRWGATRRARFIEVATPLLTADQRTKLAEIIRDHADRPES